MENKNPSNSGNNLGLTTLSLECTLKAYLLSMACRNAPSGPPEMETELCQKANYSL